MVGLHTKMRLLDTKVLIEQIEMLKSFLLKLWFLIHINIAFNKSFNEKLICCYAESRKILPRKLKCVKMEKLPRKASINYIYAQKEQKAIRKEYTYNSSN